MLTFYYHPLSPIARRVWLALLEKDIAFESRLVDLKAREQLKPDYLAIHPFHHVPAMVDQDLRLIESFAILEYLEAKFPDRPLSPKGPVAIARMKMVQLVVANELMPKLPRLVLLANQDTGPDQGVLKHTEKVFAFLEEQLGDAAYFGGDRLSLADITVGAALPLLRRLGMDLQAHPTLVQWCEHVSSRSAWQQTEPSDSDLQAWQRWLSLVVKRHQRSQARAWAAN